jgi:hypothetical protein
LKIDCPEAWLLAAFKDKIQPQPKCKTRPQHQRPTAGKQ